MPYQKFWCSKLLSGSMLVLALCALQVNKVIAIDSSGICCSVFVALIQVNLSINYVSQHFFLRHRDSPYNELSAKKGRVSWYLVKVKFSYVAGLYFISGCHLSLELQGSIKQTESESGNKVFYMNTFLNKNMLLKVCLNSIIWVCTSYRNMLSFKE